MAREARRVAAILEAGVVGRSHQTDRLARLRVQRLEPAVVRHGGRLVRLTDDGARAEFPSAAEALGAAIEFQQSMEDANRRQAPDTAVIFHLGLHLADASEDRPLGQVRRGGIVVSAPLRNALAGRVKASFAELGSTGLGTVERPVHAYEVGSDPADWPVTSAAAAMPFPARGDGRRRRRGLAFAWSLLVLALVGMAHLVLVTQPQPAAATGRVPNVRDLDRAVLERRSEAAFARWQREEEQDDGGTDDVPANADNALPVDVNDGLYAGTSTMKGAGGHVVTFRVEVIQGIGSGTQSRLDCGVAPVTLKISSTGEVRGLALIFSATCLKTELAIRGRAQGRTLQLRLGSQYLELTRRGD